MLSSMNSRVSILFCNISFMNLKWTHFRLKHALRRKPLRVLGSYDEKELPTLDGQVIPVGKKRRSLYDPKKPSVSIPIPPYVKLEEADQRYAKIFSMIRSHKPGENEDKVLLEGVRLINDAIEAGIKLEMLFFSKEEALTKIKFRKPESIELYKVLHKTLRLWSSLDCCPGIMGVFKRPTVSELKVTSEPVIPVTVLGYNIRSHKLLGSIIRNAASAGCKSVLLTKGCTHAWTPKAIRASSGAHFHIPVIENVQWLHVLNYLGNDAAVYIIDSRTESGEDVYDDLLEAADHKKEDESEDIEEADKEQENENEINEHEGSDELHKATMYVTCKNSDQQLIVDEGFKDKDNLSRYYPDLLRNFRYMDVTFPMKDIVICISEQNFCEDPRALKLACDFGGSWINIPSESKMCRVSSAFALPVILYEIKRQLGEEYVTM